MQRTHIYRSLAAERTKRGFDPRSVADPVEADDLAYSFFALLDDTELREVFGDFMVQANTLH